MVVVGVYTVTVQASNVVSNSSTMMEFVVERPIIGLTLNASSDHVQLGSDVFFEAFIDSPTTHVRFDWSYGDMESDVDAGIRTTYLNYFFVSFLLTL